MSLLPEIARQRGMHIARRSVASRFAGFPKRRDMDASETPGRTVRTGAGPARSPLPEASEPAGAFPIWFAALMATSCLAGANGENHAVRWNCVSGRAVYTNLGKNAERIEPLGVSLKGGQTLAVSWMPGETAYTVEVYGQNEKCA